MLDKKEEWETRFDELDTRRASTIKSFIKSLRSKSRDTLVERIEGLKYKEDEEDLGAEAIANHAYKDKFEAFRFGCNEGIEDVKQIILEVYK